MNKVKAGLRDGDGKKEKTSPSRATDTRSTEVNGCELNYHKADFLRGVCSDFCAAEMRAALLLGSAQIEIS